MNKFHTWCVLLLLAAMPVFAQYQTPTVDGTVSPGEYAHSSGNWSLTWNATYLYLAKTNLTNANNGVVVYLDVDPQSTPTAGTNSNGNTVGTTEFGVTPTELAFRADARILGIINNPEIKSRDGSGSWGSGDSSPSNIIEATAGSTREVRIAWASLPGLSGVPSSFRWLGYETSTNNVFDSMPAANGNFIGSSNASLLYAYKISSTADGAATDPFSVQESSLYVLFNTPPVLNAVIGIANGDATSSRRFIVFNHIDNNTINTTSDLTAITQTTTIDGTTAPGYTSTPVLVINGFSTNINNDHGIRLSSCTGCVVRGLVLQDHGFAIQITDGSGNSVVGNYIGTDAAGTGTVANSIGVRVTGCSGCTIGGTAVSDRNLISANTSGGISAQNTTSLTIQGNYIGTKANGTEALTNGVGISLSGASGTLIGGTSSGGNVINSAIDAAISTDATSDTSIYGNLIGLGADGTTALGGGDGILAIGDTRLTIGATPAASQNKVAHMSAAILIANQTGGLLNRGNSLVDNDFGIDMDGGAVQPAPTVSQAAMASSTLYVTFSLSSNNTSATTQSMQLDLYDADLTPGAPAEGSLYRTTSPCYSGNSLTNQQWSVGSGYTVGDKIVLMATAYSDANCSTPGDGTSANTSVITLTAMPAATFTGPGDFSDTTKWSGGALPLAGQNFVILNTCTFDSGAPARAYGNMTLGDGVTPGNLQWQTSNPVVLDVDGFAVNGGTGVAVDMTNGGTLLIRGDLNLGSRDFTGGTGTVQLTGTTKTLTATSSSAIFHNVTVAGVLTIANTFYFDGTLDVQTGGSLSGSGATTVFPRNGAAITGSGTNSFGQVNIASGHAVTASANFSASSTFTIDGTFTPTAATVISGGSTGTLGGTGTMKVTRTGGNSTTDALLGQYSSFATIDHSNNTVEYAGTANQFIKPRTFKNLTVNNPVSVQIANGDIHVTNVMSFTQGLVMGVGNEIWIDNSAPSAVVQGTGWTRLILHRAIATGTNTYLYPLGNGSASVPVFITFNNVTVAGNVKMQNATISSNGVQGGSGIDNSHDFPNVWTFTIQGATLSSYDAVFHFGTTYDAGSVPTKFVLRTKDQDEGPWSDVPATNTSTSISATGLTGQAQYYATGNQEIDHYVVTTNASSPQYAGDTFTTTVTAKDVLNVTANIDGRVVTMTSSTGNAQFDSDGNGTFGDNTKSTTNGAFTISTKDNVAESMTITATDTSSKSGTSSLVTIAEKVFTGPGAFSVASKWSGNALPATGAPFTILGLCSFDDGSPTRAYGRMKIGDGVTSGNLLWPTEGNPVVLDVTDVVIGAGNTGVAIDMTDAGTLRINGNITVGAGDFTGGSGTVEFNGNSTITSGSAVFHNVTVSGTASIANTFYFDGTLTVNGTFSGSASTTLYPRNGAAINAGGSMAMGQINIESGQTVTTSGNFSASSTFTIDGTFTPTATTVISGGSTGTLGGTGTMKVTRTGGNSTTDALLGQYSSFATIDHSNNTVEYAGTANQFIKPRTFKNLIVNNPVSVQLANGDIHVTNVMTFTQGLVMGVGNEVWIDNSAPSAVVQGTGWTRLIMHRAIATGTNTYRYALGNGQVSVPVDITFHNVTVAGNVKMQNATISSNGVQGGSGIDNSRDFPNVWTFTISSGTIPSYDAVFNFGTFYDAGADPTSFVLRTKDQDEGPWSNVPATNTATSISATGLTGQLAYYATGNQEIDHYVVSAPSPQSAGTPYTTTVTAQDVLNVTANITGRVVTMTSSTGNAQFDSDGNGTFGDNTKSVTNGTFTISTKDNTIESLTLTATDTNSKTGTSSSISVNLGPASAATTTIDASPSSLFANGSSTSTLTVQARDAGGNNLTTSGGTVTLATNLGAIGPVTNNNNGTYTATFTAGTQSGTATITGTIGGNPITDTAGIELFPPLTAPAAFSATATSTSEVALTWNAVSGATSYEIYRGTSLATLASLATTASLGYTDSGRSANTTYLYKVRALNGPDASAFTSVDPATTTIFTDPTITTSTTAKAAHITELRTAVNAMRAAAALSAASFTDPTPTSGVTKIKRLHIIELRTALDAARTQLGLAAISYTDPTITAETTTLKGVHVTQLRAGVQ